MLNQYYEFLANRLIEWLKSRKSLMAGDKFFATLDSEEDVSYFMQAIDQMDFSGKRYFVSNEYTYKTISLIVNNVEVLFVAPGSEVSLDFLVTVRNQVNANQDEWEGTAVLFVFSEPLDSIISGAFDVSQRDAPLDTKNINKEIKEKILPEKNLTKNEQKAIILYLNEMVDSGNAILKDYETTFSIIEKGKITQDDYNEMGYFKDEALNTFPSDSAEDRLKMNRKLYQSVEKLQGLLDIKEKLNETFSGDTLINRLSKPDEWKKIDFSDVSKGNENHEKNKKTKLSFCFDQLVEDDDNFWFRESGTRANQRKKAFFIFSSQNSREFDDKFTFEIPFDDSVSKGGVILGNSYILSNEKNKEDLNVVSKGKKLIVEVENFDSSKTYGGTIQYQHRNLNNLRFTVSFMIVPFSLQTISHLRPSFEIEILKKDKSFFYGISSQVDFNNYYFGNGENEIVISNFLEIQSRNLMDCRIVLSDDFSTEEGSRVEAFLDNTFFPISFLDTSIKPIPYEAISIERTRLKSDAQLRFEDEKVFTQSRSLSLREDYKKRLTTEKEILENRILYGQIISSEVERKTLSLPQSISDAYEELFEFYQKENTLPSLAIIDKEHKKILENIINSVNQVLGSQLINFEKPTDEVRNIALIGVLERNEGYLLNPLNPLMIQYQLELEKQLSNNLKEGRSIPKENVLATLNPQFLIPYIKINDRDYQSSYSAQYPRWLSFDKIQERQLSTLGTGIIAKRIDDYITQYKFLFESNKNMAINIAALCIVDEKNFFDAIINFIFKRLEEVNTLDEINPINIYFDGLKNDTNSLFKKFYQIRSLDSLNLLLKSPRKLKKFDEHEVIELMQKKVNVYRIKKEELEKQGVYFHIIFYQFIQQKGLSLYKMNKLDKNYAIGGLISNPQYYRDGDVYMNGFGLGEIVEKKQSNLIKFLTVWDGLLSSMNKSTDIYRQGETLVNNIPQLQQSEITPLLNNASWVTFLNIDADLSYFYDDSNGEILVIHYADQNTTGQYESLTVTKDTRQYKRLLEELVFNNKENFETNEVIKNFNVINGTWLLKIISDKSKKRQNTNMFREKLSIIAAYKELLGVFDHPDFIWVPISLEEIIRVSGMVGLSKKDGLFSSKNLNQEGSISDDLLFIGVDLREKEIKLHYLPVEVKVGINNESVTKKAINQVKHTAKIIKDYLFEYEDKFMKDYYRNFFVSIFIGNLEKLISSGLISEEKSKKYTNNLKNKLKVGEYNLSNELKDFYGEGIIFELSQNQAYRSADLDKKNVSIFRVPESDTRNVVAEKMGNIINKIKTGKFDFPKACLLEVLLPSKMEVEQNKGEVGSPENNAISNYEIEYSIPEEMEIHSKKVNYNDLKMLEDKEIIVADNMLGDKKESDTSNLVSTSGRILLGTVKHSTHKVYWEYANKNLANRHLLITGKSGQGKTYLVQMLLAELSKNRINSLVIDYTDGFLNTQLDDVFFSKFEHNIKQRYIIQSGLPINPFKLETIDLGDFKRKELPQDMVDRVVQIIDFVYDLGVQQRTLLSDCILNGFNEFGEKYTFTNLASTLRNSEDRNMQTLYGRINTLLSRDPFSYKEAVNWNNIFGKNGIINIFQLKGYQANIQKVLIEFLLWDLYQYANREGTVEYPIPLVLDEVQNLDFSSSSPAVKILREGRKFGLSGIFATQSLDSIKGNDASAIYNSAEQIHFLPPDAQTSAIAKSITTTSNDKKEVETMLKTLLKGEAVVYGPILQENQILSESRINKIKVSSIHERT